MFSCVFVKILVYRLLDKLYDILTKRKRGTVMKVVFVCLGNICRSPMAEAVFRKMVHEEGLEDKITIDSAATSTWEHGNPVHHGTRRNSRSTAFPQKGLCHGRWTQRTWTRTTFLEWMRRMCVISTLLSMENRMRQWRDY